MPRPVGNTDDHAICEGKIQGNESHLRLTEEK
jgi:hypothetical protein